MTRSELLGLLKVAGDLVELARVSYDKNKFDGQVTADNLDKADSALWRARTSLANP